ncbi:aminotransferase class I/II-fold pyridoxal phosphate-dependent enzyme [Patulibacter brassicae]|uniref:Aminotransferase n=1 Tax=Patulibacter brassicae TaxID=1705717 RepID=A0ABU4VLB3_9ACTN|nr:aminotransferase class I/II-fold pyridoxal phosphate-dependent enzyme [Patulibacter brassicae]MDX8152637.1 aminotransferase class I/II-fold pyridoxal phosphate-dependent enzyme [Patulibacter brassicae]
MPSSRSQVPPFAVMEVLDAVQRRRDAGRPVFSLCAGEPGGGEPAAVRERAAALLAGGAPLGYTPALGLPALRRAIAGHYARWYGVAVDPERVAVTTGSSGAFVLAFLAAFAPGDRVALARPGYPAYRNILRALGCEVVELPAGPDERYQPTPALLDAAVATGGPLRGVVVASPANPTGSMVDGAELDALGAWCADHGATLVSDEIYHGITAGTIEARSAWERDDRAIVVSSFSKYWGMTGWRLGWALLPETLVGAVDALAGNLALCPPTLPQLAALEAFSPAAYAEQDRAAERYRELRGLLLDRLPALGWGATAPADGAFYLYAEIGERLDARGLDDSVAWCAALLEETGVALTPGSDFDAVHGRRWVRLSYAAEEAILREGLDRIAAWG